MIINLVLRQNLDTTYPRLGQILETFLLIMNPIKIVLEYVFYMKWITCNLSHENPPNNAVMLYRPECRGPSMSRPGK